MLRAVGARLAASTLAAALTGCVFLVNDLPEAGGACRFEGDAATACGTCIADSCATLLTACCLDTTCLADAMPLLDRCAGDGDSAACAALAGSGSGATRLALRACAATGCAAKCPGLGPSGAAAGDGGVRVDGGGRDGGSGARFANVTCSGGSADYCSCSYAAGATNTTSCSSATVDNAICCADLGWPGRGLDCRCDRVECRQKTGGCECGPYTSGPDSTCRAGTHCCLSLGRTSCECVSRTCYAPSEEEVSACSTVVLGCGSDKIRVAACDR